ncbi:MAG: SHOCT domain-containing protein [Tepidisphaeraceae bacterium]
MKPSASAASIKEQIGKLESLRSMGILTDDEYEAAQKRLLAAAGL